MVNIQPTADRFGLCISTGQSLPACSQAFFSAVGTDSFWTRLISNQRPGVEETRRSALPSVPLCWTERPHSQPNVSRRTLAASSSPALPFWRLFIGI
jgi:hypothetical protein